MLEAAIDIPRPLSADTETVITALETAELFSAKGDTHEAVRWLRRAAESAGEAGDDARALALSRKAADLQEALEVKPPPASVPRPSAARSVPRPSTAPTPSASPPPVSVSPPPASVRSAMPPPLPPPLPSRPTPSAAWTVAELLATAPPLPRPPTGSAEPAPPPPSARVARTPTVPPVATRPSYPPPPSSRPGFHPPPSRPPQAHAHPLPAIAVSATTPSAANGSPSAAAPAPGERHASRVCVTKSPTRPGVFEMRLLAEGEAPPASSSEGFLVMLDPSSTVLSS